MGKVFSTGKSAAKRAQKEQLSLIQRQRQQDELALSEEEDVIARKKALASGRLGGRQSLIKTSETGVRPNNLGGVI